MQSDIKYILIGGSAGSTRIIENLLSRLPHNLQIPIIIIRHMGEGDDMSEYYKILSRSTEITISEAEDKGSIDESTVYFAPPGYHLLIEENRRFALDLSPRSNFSRPSIDILFQSAAKAFGSSAASILLSGANSDGSAGSVAIYDSGGLTIAQDPEEAEFPQMPLSAIKTEKITAVLKINEISCHIIELNDNFRRII